MRDRNKNKKSFLTDFIRYHDDKMNGEERNAFERELQKDPFAEEAAEGFSRISSEKAVNDIAGLRKRLQRRTGKGSYYLFYRIAAAVTVIVIVSSVFIVIRREKQPLAVSQNISRETKAPVSVSAPEKPEVSLVKPPERIKVVSSPSNVKQAEQTGKKEINEERITEFREPGLKDTAVTLHDLAYNADIPAAGVVTAEAKMMESARGAGTPLKGKSEPVRDYQPPQPVTGTDVFNRYIETSIRNPEPGKAKQEVVTLSFLVYNDSTISEIKIISSPGEEYSGEAIRLIKEGPVWKPAMEDMRVVEDSVRVNIVFK
jgi:hypothetical protein